MTDVSSVDRPAGVMVFPASGRHAVIEVNPYPLDPGEVVAFFQAHGEDVVVGLTGHDEECPLACFLKAQYPGSTFAVGFANYQRLMADIDLGPGLEEVYSLPEWAEEFVWLVDASTNFCDGGQVTALDALLYLYTACSYCGVSLQEVHHD